jgi:hypothetical protein
VSRLVSLNDFAETMRSKSSSSSVANCRTISCSVSVTINFFREESLSSRSTNTIEETRANIHWEKALAPVSNRILITIRRQAHEVNEFHHSHSYTLQALSQESV